MYEMWAWLVDEADGSTGPVAEMVPPFVICLHSSDQAMAESMRPVARAHAKATGRPVRLAHLIEVDR